MARQSGAQIQEQARPAGRSASIVPLYAGYGGVRCEKCTAENHYFDESQARCLDCGDIAAKVTVAAGTLSILLRAAVAVRVVIHRHQGSAARTLLHWLQSAQRVWQVAGMRYKVKRL
eukprot:3945870-Prymnesium_polylepis.1